MTKDKGADTLTGQNGWAEPAGCPVYNNEDITLAARQVRDVMTNNPDLSAFVAVKQEAKAGNALFGVTYTNAGFDMVWEARAIVQGGKLGTIRIVRVQFPQEWLASAVEAEGNKRAEWRADPKRSGAGSLGDIGTHAFHLAEFVSGLRYTSVSAEVDSFVAGRRVDDNVSVQLRFGNGSKASL